MSIALAADEKQRNENQWLMNKLIFFFFKTQQFILMVFDLNSNWAGTDNGSDQFHVKVRWERGELSTPDGDE